ncbi:hypothetical protein Tco_1109679 [Tanacetum coccineum]
MDNVNKGTSTLKSSLKASKIRNIKGKIISKDGKPLCPVRQTVRAPNSQRGINKEGEGKEDQTLQGAVASVPAHTCNENLARIFKNKCGRDAELKKVVTMAVPIIDGEGHTKERMNVEYEWKPPRYREKERKNVTMKNSDAGIDVVKIKIHFSALHEQDDVFIQSVTGESSGNGDKDNTFAPELEVRENDSEVEEVETEYATKDDTT